MTKRGLCYILFCLISLNSFSLSVDSLRIKLKKAKNDSIRIELHYKAANAKANSEQLSDSLLNCILSYTNSADCYSRLFANYKVALYYIGNEKREKAMQSLLLALDIADKCKNNYGIMIIRLKLGYLNKITERVQAAKTCLHVSRYYAILLKDSAVLADNYVILGNIYKNEMILDSALDYQLKALRIREKTKGDERLLAQSYNNIGLVYKNMKEYNTALTYLKKSLVLKIKIKDNTLASAYNNLGIIYNKMKLYDSAVAVGKKGMEAAYKFKKSEFLSHCVQMLAEAYDGKKDIAKALYYYKKDRDVRDSVGKEEISTQFLELQSKYESDKKDADLKLKEESLKTADALNSRKNILIILSIIALLMALIAGVFIFRSYKQSKRNAFQLELKNKIIGEKNKEITDSINYAKNIQEGLITNESVFKENLKDHFILYLPKDIVSGDFYWAQKVGKEFLIMCADCTGHGVPGAFMSLMGIGFLKEIVNQKELVRPDLILNELRDRIINSFGLNDNKDGMDASLVKLNGKEMQVSAANNSIWILRDNESMVVKPDKFPVGVYSGDKQDFTLNTIQLQNNDLVLMYTDGYGDQFGGPSNKKFKHKTMEKLLLDNKDLSMEQMKKLLSDTLLEWKGNYEQVDDILVLGFRI